MRLFQGVPGVTGMAGGQGKQGEEGSSGPSGPRGDIGKQVSGRSNVDLITIRIVNPRPNCL